MDTLDSAVPERLTEPAWDAFLNQLEQFRQAGQTSAAGEAYWRASEDAAADLYEGLVEEDCRLMYGHVLRAQLERGLITPGDLEARQG